MADATPTIVTLAEDSALADQLRRSELQGTATWPPFFAGDAVNTRLWPELYATFPAFQVVLRSELGELLAAGHSLPLCWDGTLAGLPAGWDAAMEQGFRHYQRQEATDTLCALAVVVAPGRRGEGWSTLVVRALRTLAERQRLQALIVPLRPTLKSRYPLTPMERYIQWQRPDGLPLDPWLRVHHRLGARQLRIAPRSMVMTGTIRDWERWTDMRLPESGSYVVPGALQPVTMDCEQGAGRYEEPNLWLLHAVGGAEAATTSAEVDAERPRQAERSSP